MFSCNETGPWVWRQDVGCDLSFLVLTWFQILSITTAASAAASPSGTASKQRLGFAPLANYISGADCSEHRMENLSQFCLWKVPSSRFTETAPITTFQHCLQKGSEWEITQLFNGNNEKNNKQTKKPTSCLILSTDWELKGSVQSVCRVATRPCCWTFLAYLLDASPNNVGSILLSSLQKDEPIRTYTSLPRSQLMADTCQPVLL